MNENWGQVSTGYMVNTIRRAEWIEMRLYPVLQMLSMPDHELLLLSSFTRIEAYGRSGMAWTAENVVPDQLKMNTVENGKIKCTGWDPAESRKVLLDVDLLSGRVWRVCE